MNLIMKLILLALAVVVACSSSHNRQIVSGDIWLDTEGKMINAHGGGMLYHDGTYYWYGEIKEGETYLPECNASWGGTRVDVTGVSCYSSKDLYNWKYEGNVLPAVEDDASHDLYIKNVLERPKVIYNKSTKQFVMWMHIDSMDYLKAGCGIAVSDSPVGPFTYLQSIRPNSGKWPVNVTTKDTIDGALARDFSKGQMARDMTLFVDDDQKAYLFYSSEENATHHMAELSDDYLSLSGRYKRLFEDRFMEAPAVFKRQGEYYFIASGCTAWAPNAARCAVAESIWGPWTEIGNPCHGEGADQTFTSQSTYVLPVQGKDDTFIFMAGRWNKDDLEDSRYIWLPLQFDAAGTPYIEWFDEWSID